jgi:putative ABC transport system ATP-binding protein
MVSGPLLEARNLLPCFDDGRASSRGSDLSLMAGSLTRVMGEDSHQVSIWLQCLAGLLDPCAGQVRMEGQDLSRLDKRAWQRMRTRIAYLSRDSSLMSVFSMLDNVIQPALYHKLASREQLLSEARVLLDEIGSIDAEQLQQLPAYTDQRCYAQVLIVRVLLLQPRIIIVDDFFSHYDKKIANELLQYIFIRLEQQGMAALVYDHDMTLSMDKQAGTVFVAHDGLLAYASREALLASDNAQVQAFLLNHEVDVYGR